MDRGPLLQASGHPGAKVCVVEAEATIERVSAERDELRARLTEAEQLLADMPSLRASREELEAIHRSLAWRATAPMRRLEETVGREVFPAIKRALLRLARARRGPQA
jgi:hypothetical protein